MLFFWRDGGLDAALSFFGPWTSQHFGVSQIFSSLFRAASTTSLIHLCLYMWHVMYIYLYNNMYIKYTKVHIIVRCLLKEISYHIRNALILGDASSLFCSRIYQSSNTTTPSPHKNLSRMKSQPGLVDHQLQNASLSALGRASLWQAALLEILVGQGQWCCWLQLLDSIHRRALQY